MDETQAQPPAIDARAFSALEDIADGDRAFLSAVIRQFLADAAKRIGELVGAGSAADPDSLFRAAHALKSSSANLGALRLSDLADRLQSLGREGRIEAARALIGAAVREFDRVRESLGERLVRLSS